MASLFKNKTIEKKLQSYHIPSFDDKIERVKEWYASYKSGALKKKTESQCEQAFNQHFFVEILGYESFPNRPYTIDPKACAEATAQKPDAILGYFDQGSRRVIAVVEIKNAKTPLDKSQRREGNLSPIQQAFKYKPQYKECSFVIATNFFEIRLLKDNQLDYESFTLKTLSDPTNNYFEFRKFHFLLNAKNFIRASGKSDTERLLSDIRIEQEAITKDFYREYKRLRSELIENILKNNEVERHAAISNAQKIIDRIVFVCFCEDLDLLPENKLQEVVDYGERAFFPVWDTMRNFFRAIDQGSERLGIPDGYNGELFKADPDLDRLKIDDRICKKFVDLGKYDFSEDLSVNILGHIFEQSISDIERLKKNGEGDKKTSKRKKDGIFYTPDYIVDYIVKNALGSYLEEKEKAILETHGLKEDIQDVTYKKRALKAYETYRSALQKVKVLDPACGSGAFLVKVYDYLLAENMRVNEIITELQPEKYDLFTQEQYIRSLLENNIYGVDINEESVEITKLSLWLKTAVKGKKLTNLKDNIKCGNSLIDDPDIAGEKAFSWDQEFPEIMGSGGFDVVVGNPPYGAELSKNDQIHLSRKFYIGSTDTAILFIKLSYGLIKTNGFLGFIIPKAFTFSSNYKKIRSFVWDDILGIVDCRKVWKEVKLEQIIINMKKKAKSKEYLSSVLIQNSIDPLNYVGKETAKKFGFFLNGVSKREIEIGEKIYSAELRLNDIATNRRGAGLQKHVTETGDLPVIGGAEIGRFGFRGKKGRIKKDDVTKEQAYISENSVLAQNIVAHIENPIDHIKIISCVPPDKEPVILDTINQISIENDYSNYYVWCLFNSNLINWYSYRFIFAKAIRTMHFDNAITKRIPVKKLSDSEQSMFIEKAKFKLSLNKELQEKAQKTLSFLQSEYGLKKIPKKLKTFWELDFPAFQKALKLKKRSLKEKKDLMEFFDAEKAELSELKQEIDRQDAIIDEMVFDLYELDEKERRIVKNM